MTNLFFKDKRGNFWSMTKVVGFVRDTPLNENGEEISGEVHYLAILEGGMSTEISFGLYDELTRTLITLESAEEAQVEEVGE